MDSIEDVGVFLASKRRKPTSKDPNPEWFWAELDMFKQGAALKARQPKWGPRRIFQGCGISEKKCKNVLENYFFDGDTSKLFRKSQSISSLHRVCVSKAELIDKLKENHLIDHRKSDVIYQELRTTFFPIVREYVALLFKTEIQCHTCLCAADLPKITRNGRPIPATYPNSRWQIDLKKNAVVQRLQLCYNGREFRNSDLEAVVKEFDAIQMHGRPYHPQSQGRVERFNRTMTEYFRCLMVNDSNLVGSLSQFYYHYNNRVHKATRPSTPYQMYFRRPNFATPMNDQVAYACLTKEERAFLESAHLDVEEDEQLEEANTEVTHTATRVDDESDTCEVHPDEGLIATPTQPDLNSEVTIIIGGGRHSVKSSGMLDMVDETTSTGVAGKGEYNWSPMSMPTLSPAIPLEKEDTVKERDPPCITVESESPIPRAALTAVPDNFDLSDTKKIKEDRTTNQIARERYPLEQFADNLREEVIFLPNVGERVYYRLNPALAAGTTYLTSGLYRPGTCCAINKTCTGTSYAITDEQSAQVHNVNRYQLRQC